MKVQIKLLDPNATVPKYAKPGDAGQDFTATSMSIDKYGNRHYGTGMAVAIPPGYVGLLFPRSSVSKYQLSLANAVGVIDSGYRGEIMFKFKPTLTYNPLRDPKTFMKNEYSPKEYYKIGDAIGQMVILPYPQIEWSLTDDLDDTERGTGSYGSSGQ